MVKDEKIFTIFKRVGMIILYWISRGVTEGLKWSDEKDYGHKYHLWRLVEVIAVILAIVLYKDFWNLIGQSLIGIFIYERILMKMASNKWFKDEGWIFEIGFNIPRHRWQDYLILICGIILLVFKL